MSNQPQVITPSDVAKMPDSTPEKAVWINDVVCGVCCTLEKKNSKAGKTFWVAEFADEADPHQPKLAVMFFMAPKFSQGDIVRLSGQGTRKDSYNGQAQLKLGKTPTIEVRAGEKRVEAAVHEHKSEQAAHQMINGASVAFCVNRALEILSKDVPGDVLREGTSHSQWFVRLHTLASDIYRITHHMEQGNLAPSVKERNHTTAPTPPKPVAPPPSDVESELDSQDQPPF